MCKLHSGQCSDTDEGDGGDEQPEDLDDAGYFGDDEAVDQEEETDFDDGESMVDFDLEEDDDDGGGEETVTSVVHPVQSVGCITHVNITRTAQIQRRTRKWRTYTHPPNGNDEAEPPHNTRSERNLAAHAKKQLIGLRSTNSIQIIEASELPKRILRELGVDGVVGEPGVGGVVGEHGVRGVVGQPARDFIIMGWGRRPGIGKMYGAKYVRLYAKDIEEMFNQGAARSSEKLGAGRIVEILKTRYPLRHNIPAEKDIKAEISRLFNQQKRRKAGGSLANPPPPKKPRVCVRDEITEFLVRKIQENPNMLPADAVRELHLHVPTATEDPSDEYLRRKFSSMKQQSRKKQLLSTLPTLLV